MAFHYTPSTNDNFFKTLHSKEGPLAHTITEEQRQQKRQEIQQQMYSILVRERERIEKQKPNILVTTKSPTRRKSPSPKGPSPGITRRAATKIQSMIRKYNAEKRVREIKANKLKEELAALIKQITRVQSEIEPEGSKGNSPRDSKSPSPSPTPSPTQSTFAAIKDKTTECLQLAKELLPTVGKKELIDAMNGVGEGAKMAAQGALYVGEKSVMGVKAATQGALYVGEQSVRGVQAAIPVAKNYLEVAAPYIKKAVQTSKEVVTSAAKVGAEVAPHVQKRTHESIVAIIGALNNIKDFALPMMQKLMEPQSQIDTTQHSHRSPIRHDDPVRETPRKLRQRASDTNRRKNDEAARFTANMKPRNTRNSSKVDPNAAYIAEQKRNKKGDRFVSQPTGGKSMRRRQSRRGRHTRRR